MKKTMLAAVMLGLATPGLHAQKKKANLPSAETKAISKSDTHIKAMSESDINEKVDALLAKMTLEDKVGQMAQITLDVIGKGASRYTSDVPYTLDSAKVRKALVDYRIGSVLNTAANRALTPQVWYETIKGIQVAAIGNTPLHIPVIFGIDAIHGATFTAGATLFPQEIAQAATRNRALVRRGAEITAYETRASNTPWVFSPVLDLGADPRFARIWESFGEDPYIGAQLGQEIVKGYEGETNNINDPTHVAASIKHFLGYQVSVSGKDRTPANISDQAMYEYHLPAFKAGIAAGAHTIMINSGLINGVPVHANYNLLTKLLKEDLGFKGLAVTDWQDIDNLYHRDHIAASEEDAIAIAINAGIDMSMIPYNYEPFCDGLVKLVKEGKVKQSRVDDAVRRILRVKFALGLFEKPVTNYKDYPLFGSASFEHASYESAAEAITLLKNDGNILPLTKGKKILVTGPNANTMRVLDGAWSYSWQGDKVDEYASKYNTILEALQNKAGKENVTYVPGVSYKADGHYYDENPDKLDEAVAAAANVDVVVLCLGENSYAEKPGDLNDLYISDLQTQLAQKLIATGKPVVLVLTEGRPRIISRFEQGLKGVVQAYLPGNFGGDALADVLYGDVNPSGKLPYTYPRYPNALIGYIHKPSEEQKKAEGVYNYEADYNPQYPFGYGLSYTTFTYSNLTVDKSSFHKTDSISITVQVANTGSRAGKEAVELYTSDLVASLVSPDVKRLRGFEKISLQPGETKTVTFVLHASDLAFAGVDGKPVLEAGDFEVHIAKLTQKFTLVE
jgi:beta-glucosidase